MIKEENIPEPLYLSPRYETMDEMYAVLDQLETINLDIEVHVYSDGETRFRKCRDEVEWGLWWCNIKAKYWEAYNQV